MRSKGYNTGSSGFWGDAHVKQVMDIASPIDARSRALLSEHGITVTDRDIRFTPEDPTDLESVTKTWDMIATILPNLGRHAEPADNAGASIFRYATKQGLYGDYLELWIWQTGALDGHLNTLALALAEESGDARIDYSKRAHNAALLFRQLGVAAYRELVAEASASSQPT